MTDQMIKQLQLTVIILNRFLYKHFLILLVCDKINNELLWINYCNFRFLLRSHY